MNEYLLTVDNYKKQKVMSGNKGNYYMLLRLFLLEPGTNPLFPLMGLGLRSRVRFLDETELPDVKVDIEKQIETYLPSLMVNDISLELENSMLKITISTDTEDYQFSSNDFNLNFDTLVEEYSDN